MGRDYLVQTRDHTSQKIEELKHELTTAKRVLGDGGTIFATGSFGRLEAGPESDLDVFIVVRLTKKKGSSKSLPALNEVQQIRLKSELIVAAEKAGLAEFDSGGKFLKTHILKDFVEQVGSPEDDYRNTFTGRMLLLLESQALIGDRQYNNLLSKSTAAYFHDFKGNESNFIPYFLINDLLRMWRTFCVNYEFFRKGTSDWRIKNLKLKYTRMLTCFSAIMYILAIFREKQTVSPQDIIRMAEFTPIERLEQFLAGGRFESIGKEKEVAARIENMLDDYGEFLEFVREKKEAIRQLKKEEDIWRERSYEFGSNIAATIGLVSGDGGMENPLYRSLLV